MNTYLKFVNLILNLTSTWFLLPLSFAFVDWGITIEALYGHNLCRRNDQGSKFQISGSCQMAISYRIANIRWYIEDLCSYRILYACQTCKVTP